MTAIRASWLIALISFVVAAPLFTRAAPVGAQTGSHLFPETGKTVKGKFLAYWNSHGGLAQQGLPISEEMQEVSDTDGKSYTVQYFERAVFELHPENGPPHDVLLSLLGTFRYQQKYPQGEPAYQTYALQACTPRYDPNGLDRDCPDFANQAEAQCFYLAAGGPATDPHRLDRDGDGQACDGDLPPGPAPAPPPSAPTPRPPAQQPSCVNFPETGKSVCGRFLTYWREHGGLAQQGFPISAEFTEVSDLNGQPYTVQYFQRAVFEQHPENAPPHDVLLSQLGTFRYKEKYAATAEARVDIKDLQFKPQEITVAKGTRVTWTQSDVAPHTVVSRAEPKVLNSPYMDKVGSAYSYTFISPGTYEYWCTVHPEMVARVIVK